jgi:hypothetical protein
MSVCSRLFTVFMSAENQEGRGHTARPYGLTKPEVSRVAFKSLWLALNNSQFPFWRFVAWDNSGSEEFRAWMHKHSWAHFASDGVPIHAITSYDQRTDAACRALVDGLGAEDDDWILLAEDDQVWAGDSLYLILDFISTYSGDFVIVPYVQPYMIWAGLQERQCGSQMALTVDSVGTLPKIPMGTMLAREKLRVVLRTRLHHWMQVFWTNGTLLTRVGLLRKWWRENPKVLDHGFMEKMSATVPFFAPIPSLSTHFQEGCQSPGFNQRVTEEWVRGLLRP